MIPPSQVSTWDGAHRLIPSKFSDSGTVLSEIADGEAMLEDIVLLDGATNGRILGETRGLPGISTFELVYGIPNAHIVNAAFTYAGVTGGRLNDHTRGAWYASGTLETSIAEVSYHKARRLNEIVVPELAFQKPDVESSTYDDWLADFHSTFYVLEPPAEFAGYLQPEPVPECYRTSQPLAKQLLESKSNGIVYPSVRKRDSTCLVCFRPALVYNPRRGSRISITFVATEHGYEKQEVMYGLPQ